MSGKVRGSTYDPLKTEAICELLRLIDDCKGPDSGLALSEMVVGEIMPGITPDGEIIYGTSLFWTACAIDKYAKVC